MYPFRNRAVLSPGDIKAAQILYGQPATSAPAPIAQPAPPPKAPLRLTIDAMPVTSRAETISATGTVTGGVVPVLLQWQTASAGAAAGRATGSRTWSIAAIPLQPGENTITISALDGDASSAPARQFR